MSLFGRIVSDNERKDKMTSNNQEILKPCPFCGSSKDVVVFSDDDRHHGMCWGCLCKTKDFDTKEEAIKAWNTRPTPKTLDERKLNDFLFNSNEIQSGLLTHKKGCLEIARIIAQAYESGELAG